MTYFTVPLEARALSDALSAEASVIRRACGTWATPEALKAAERATERMASQLDDMKAALQKARAA